MLKRTNVITTLTIVISTRTRVISTRRVWLWHSYLLKPHSTCRNHSCLWCSHAYCDEHTHKCNCWSQSVISTRTSVIYIIQSAISTLKVWFLHAECNFHTQCDGETHKCDFITQKSDFYTHECDLHTHECDLHTHECDLHTQELNFNSIRVTLKRTN
jgi:hypothetical protein